MSGFDHLERITRLIASAQPSSGVLVEPPVGDNAWFEAVNFVRGVHCGVNQWRDMRDYRCVGRTVTGFVYFVVIGLPYITHVKIGYTAHDPEKRLRSLQTGCPYPMRLLGYVFGDVRLEQDLHRRMEGNRAIGEWFEYDESVADLIIAELKRIPGQ
jgi:hypothetical protein